MDRGRCLGAVAAAGKKTSYASESRHYRDPRDQSGIILTYVALKITRSKERACYGTEQSSIENESALYMHGQRRDQTESTDIRDYLLCRNDHIEHFGADSAA